MNFTRVTLDYIKKHIIKIVGVPAFMSALVFMANIVLALSDGVISEDEFHSLVSTASGTEAIILVIVMAILRVKR